MKSNVLAHLCWRFDSWYEVHMITKLVHMHITHNVLASLHVVHTNMHMNTHTRNIYTHTHTHTHTPTHTHTHKHTHTCTQILAPVLHIKLICKNVQKSSKNLSTHTPHIGTTVPNCKMMSCRDQYILSKYSVKRIPESQRFLG